MRVECNRGIEMVNRNPTLDTIHTMLYHYCLVIHYFQFSLTLLESLCKIGVNF
jgi:hypothetical protein